MLMKFNPSSMRSSETQALAAPFVSGVLEVEQDRGLPDIVRISCDSLVEHLLWFGFSGKDKGFQCVQNFRSNGEERIGWNECQALLNLVAPVLPGICKDSSSRYLLILETVICVVFCDAGKPWMIVAISAEADAAVCERLFGIPPNVSSCFQKQTTIRS